MYTSDVIVVGSGVAGLSLAIKVAEQRSDLQLVMLTKGALTESNSNYAQGGIASVSDWTRDSFEKHVQDTMNSGAGLSDPAIVDLVVRSGPERIRELVNIGAKFTRKANSDLDLCMEGGHSSHRVVHANDNTGAEVVRALKNRILELKNIRCFEQRFGMDLLANSDDSVGGIRVLNTETDTIEVFQAKIIVLATGGAGQVYNYTTNPSIATGDGIAMGIKAGVSTSNLNFIQFHPTALLEPGRHQLFLISEAVRGYGAYIRNSDGKRFLFDADPRGELATRDIVSKAIYNELKSSGKNQVYLDCTHLDAAAFETKFPMINQHLRSCGIRINEDLVPVVPAAHYMCGGIKVNERGQTNRAGLYAIGECSETGLHGANRLASNSLLEALVFAHEAAASICNFRDDSTFDKLIIPDNMEVDHSHAVEFEQLAQKVKETMSLYATIASNKSDLKHAWNELTTLNKQYLKLRNPALICSQELVAGNVLTVATAIVDAKITECESADDRALNSNKLITSARAE